MREKVTEQAEILTVTLTTTLACNLRCTYCYEKEKLGKSRMSPEVMDRVIHWMKTRIEQNNVKKLNIIFFGGEPLLHREAIRKIGGTMGAYCRERDVEYDAGVITNGIFLTPEVADEIQNHGCTWVKITFDGDKCEHDKRRIYSGGRGTFDKIFSNLENIAGKLKLLIGGNFDEETADSFKKLLFKLAHSKFQGDIACTNFKPIVAEMKERGEGDLRGIGSSCENCAFTDFQIREILELNESIRRQGFMTGDPINTGPCEFYRRNAVTMGVNGELYKCIAFIGMPSAEIGDVNHQEFNEIGEAMLKASKPFEHPKCSKCAFPPICGGGCRANAYNTTGSFENISCQQEYFKKAITAELPKEHYEGIQWAKPMGEL
jgi:uncharacterized protein